jgi:uncharacterized membrane protein YfcA
MKSAKELHLPLIPTDGGNLRHCSPFRIGWRRPASGGLTGALLNAYASGPALGYVLGALLIFAGLSGTTGFADRLVVDGARMPAYFVTQHESILRSWPIVVVATVGVVIGTIIGSMLLHRIPERTFKRAVSLLVLGLGIFMFLRPVNS